MAHTVSASLPASLTYVPMFREFVSDVLIRASFSERFAYRTEIIVDELCSNAIKFGSHDSHSRIEIRLTWDDDHIELSIIDEGGNPESIDALKKSINDSNVISTVGHNTELSLGLEIVKTLSEHVDVVINDDNITAIHVVRRREGR